MIRNKFVAVFLSIVMVAGIGVVVVAAAPAATFSFTFVSANTFSPKLLSSIGNGDGEIDILIETNSGDYGSLVNLIEGRGGAVTQQFRYINAIAASLGRADVISVAAHDNVARMYVDEIVTPMALPAASPALPGLDGMTNPMPLEAGNFQVADITMEDLSAFAPENYWNNIAAGAIPVWGPTAMGAGTSIAIIDTGIHSSHFLIGPGRILGGADLSTDALPVPGPFAGFDAPLNHWHGSFVASVAGGFGAILATPGVFSLIADSIEFYTGIPLPVDGGTGLRIIPLFGIAPLIEFFIVKVFPHTGAGAPSSTIIAGIETVIAARLSGLDIDVMNLSLGGAVLFDGRDLSDMAIDAATAVGITPVISAGNDGPSPATLSSPGTSNTAITVGAASHPVNTRVFWDFNFLFPGAGALLRVDPDIQVIGFSSRGPTADGEDDPRLFGKPDMMATGLFNLAAFPVGGSTSALAFASGTSFSAPGVTGGVALLNSFAELSLGSAATPFDYKQAMLAGASPVPDFGPEDQGAGYIDVTASLADLIAQAAGGGLGDVQPALATEIGEDTFDIENIDLDDDECNGNGGDDDDDDVECFETDVSLGPGLSEAFVFEIEDRVAWIEISLTDVDLGGFDPVGFNQFEFYIHSAERSSGDYYVDTLNIFGDTTITITDDSTDIVGDFSVDVAPVSHIIEPGFFKVIVENDHTSADTVSGTLTIKMAEADDDDDDAEEEEIEGKLGQGESTGFIFVDVPDGTTMAILELSWDRDWTQYPATDLDLIVFSNLGGFNFDGATLNSPERVVLVGDLDLLFVLVDGFEVNPFGEEEEFELEIFFFGDFDDEEEDDD